MLTAAMKFLLLPSLLLLTLTAGLRAGSEEDFARIVALDAGPKKKPSSPDEAALLARNHFVVHRKAIEDFLLKYPQHPGAFDARLRLAAITAAEGKMDNNPRKVEEALRLYTELEKTAPTPEKKADVGFSRVSLVLQSQSGDTNSRRDAIVAAAKNYTARYAGDRRGPRLLVEAATLCDNVPAQKRDLLDEASRLTSEPALKARIADDFKRLDLVGRRIDLKMSTVNAGEVDLASFRGDVTILIFWAADSPHSLLWLQNFRAAWEKMAKKQLRVVTVSLDTNKGLLTEKLRDLPPQWPTAFDGKGWEGPVPRAFGINAIPTVWILDRQGVLRALNARDDYQFWIERLLAE